MDDALYFVWVVTLNGRIADLKDCKTIEKAILHGMKLAKKYKNVIAIEIEEFDETSYEMGQCRIVYRKEIIK